jgi:hypothetical protein
MRCVGRDEHDRPCRHPLLDQAVMHVGGRQQAKAGMMVLGVVPGEEDVAVGAGFLDGAEPFRERRPLRRPASGRIRAMEYRLDRLLETSHAP